MKFHVSIWVLAAVLAGCGGSKLGPSGSGEGTGGSGGDPTSNPGPSDPSENQSPPPVFNGGGQSAHEGKPYPAEPHGNGVGSVIKPYDFFGFGRPDVYQADYQAISLADFYNPTGAEVFPEGSPMGAGTPKPKGLVIVRSAVWCGPCQQEASSVIPGQRTTFLPKGGEFFTVLDQGQAQGSTPTLGELRAWSNTFHLNYPAAVNPGEVLSEIIGVDAYPGNIMVRTKDMKIIRWTNTPDNSFWQVFGKMLNGEKVLPDDT